MQFDTKSKIDNIKKLIEKLSIEFEKDVDWNEISLVSVNSRIASKSAKYINYWVILNVKLNDEVQPRYDELYMNRYVYYKEESNVKYTQTEINKLIEMDKEMADIKTLRALMLSALGMLEKYIKNLEQMRYDFRVYVDIEKLRNGIV